ncbi:MAG: hypothetical protein V3W11_06820, partial [bacterium]
AGEVAPAAGKLTAMSAREKETPPAEEKPGVEPWRARAGAGAPGEVATSPPATSVTGEATTGEFAPAAGKPADVPARDEDAVSAEGRLGIASRGARAGAGAAGAAAASRYELAATEEKSARTLAAKKDAPAEALYPAPASADESTAAPFAARTRAGYDAAYYARGAEGSTFGLLADDDGTPALAELEEDILTAADVEARMDARFEVDVERLTGGDGAALVDYVTPNGLLMTYFYELPVEEQRMLLSRLRRKAEAATAAELLLSH